MSNKPLTGKELKIPSSPHEPKDGNPVYVLLYTDLNTYRKFNLLNERIEKVAEEEGKYRNPECDVVLDEFVLHGLRLYEDKGDKYNKTYDFTKPGGPHADSVEEYNKISPGLSKNFTTHMHHMNHQYQKHGWRIALKPEEYLNNIVFLYRHFKLNEKIKEKLKIFKETSKDKGKNGDQITWKTIKGIKLLEELATDLKGKPGISYFKLEDPNGSKILVVDEIELYLDKNFKIMDVPLNREFTVKRKAKAEAATEAPWKGRSEDFAAKYACLLVEKMSMK